MTRKYDTKTLLDYVEGDLDGEEQMRITKWMREDARLRRIVSGMISDREELHRMPDPAAPERILEAVYEKLDLERPEQGVRDEQEEAAEAVPQPIPFPEPKVSRKRLGWSIGVGVAAAILIGFTIHYSISLGGLGMQHKEIAENRTLPRDRLPRMRRERLTPTPNVLSEKDEQLLRDENVGTDNDTEEGNAPNSVAGLQASPAIAGAGASQQGNGVDGVNEGDGGDASNSPAALSPSNIAGAIAAEDPNATNPAGRPRNVFGAAELPVRDDVQERANRSERLAELQRQEWELVPFDADVPGNMIRLIKGWSADGRTLEKTVVLVQTTEFSSTKSLIELLSGRNNVPRPDGQQMYIVLRADQWPAAFAELAKQQRHRTIQIYVPSILQKSIETAAENETKVPELIPTAIGEQLIRVPISVQTVR